MKRILIRQPILACAFLLVFAACASTKAPEVSYQDFSGEAVSVSKYGNVLTDISAAEFEAAGYEKGDILIVLSETLAEEAPYVSTYSDVDRGRILVCVNQDSGQLELAINYGNLSERFGIVSGSAVTLRMAGKGAYLSEFEIRYLEKSENRSDYASDAVFANFREIKAGSIRAGTLYRSCNPILGDPRAPYAAALAEAAGIKTIINLADSDEELAQRGPSSPWYNTLIENGNVVNLNMGVDFQSQDFPVKLKKGLQFLIANEGPYLVHCNEGKDRAGIVSALLEGVSGASLSDIQADYMASYANYYGVTPNEARYAPISNIIVDILKEMNKGGAVTDRNLSQVIENYLVNDAGLSVEEISRLKVRLR